MNNQIKTLVQKYINDVIKHRRHLHANPELGFEEFETTKYIQNVLNGYGLTNHKIALKKTNTGVYVDIDSGKPGKTILFRADIDALPLQEMSNVEYKSKKDGIAHMCGHDGHTANLLGVAAILNEMKDKFKGKVRLLFQPAEEGPDLGGAVEIVQENEVMSGIDNAFAMHTYGAGEFGKIYFKQGPLYAGFIDFEITIKSKGGHCSEPHKCPDPIYIGSQLVCAFQTIMTKIKSPLENAVLAIGTFNSGSNANVIPMDAKMTGTIRIYDFELGRKIVKAMKDLTKSICETYGAEYELDFLEGYPPCINDDKITQFAMEATKKIIGSDNIKTIANPKFGAEDFAYFSNLVPSTYFMLGIHQANKEEPLHHSGQFEWDDSALAISLAVSVNLIIEFLNNN